MWQKLVVLLLYSLFLFIVFRTCEWYYYGPLGALPSVIRPMALSARKLRAVLEHRGLLYTGMFEKPELAQVLDLSGMYSA